MIRQQPVVNNQSLISDQIPKKSKSSNFKIQHFKLNGSKFSFFNVSKIRLKLGKKIFQKFEVFGFFRNQIWDQPPWLGRIGSDLAVSESEPEVTRNELFLPSKWLSDLFFEKSGIWYSTSIIDARGNATGGYPHIVSFNFYGFRHFSRQMRTFKHWPIRAF